MLGPEAGRVVLEITERYDVTGLPDLHGTVEEIAARGFRIAVDDVGAGYSSLSVLANLQPHFIKVDRSIVANVHREAQKERIVSLLALLARSGDAKLVAEGVEREEEAYLLDRCGAPDPPPAGRPVFLFPKSRFSLDFHPPSDLGGPGRRSTMWTRTHRQPRSFPHVRPP